MEGNTRFCVFHAGLLDAIIDAVNFFNNTRLFSMRNRGLISIGCVVAIRQRLSSLAFFLFFCWTTQGYASHSIIETFEEESECAQVMLQVLATGEPGQYKFVVHSDKAFVSLKWFVISSNTNWSENSGTRWDYQGTEAEIIYDMPFNGPFRVRFDIQYPVEPDNYCTSIVEQDVEVTELSYCAARITPVLYDRASYEFTFGTSAGTSIPGLNTVQWDFGDGNVSSAYNPQHTYAQEGTYIVKLTRNYDGCMFETYDTLEVGCDHVRAKIISTKINEPGQYQFTAEVSEYVKSYTWDFGDGNTWVNMWKTAHKYDKDGTYAVSYTAHTLGGCTVTAFDTVAITDAHLCGIGEMTIVEKGPVGEFDFKVTTDKEIKTVHWGLKALDTYFLYGSLPIYNVNKNYIDLSYKLPYNGPYRVGVNLAFEYAPGKYCYTDLIDTVEVYGYPCEGEISAVRKLYNELAFDFELKGINLGKEGTGTTLWEFGDGTASDAFQPSHTYAEPGIYPVKVTRSYYGCTTEVYDTVRICVNGETNVEVTPGDSPGEYKFTVNAFDKISYAYWAIFDDSEDYLVVELFDLNSPTHTVTHSFDRNGVYQIWAVMFTEGGCMVSAYHVLEVNDGDDDFNCEDIQLQLHFNKLEPGKYRFEISPSNEVKHVAWDFGTGHTGSDLDPVYQYTENGTYEVYATVETQHGCTIVIPGLLQITDIVITGIQPTEGTELLQAFPNPSNGLFSLSYPVTGIIYDWKGVVVMQVKDQQTVDLRSFGTGVYVIRTTQEELVKLVVR